MRELRTIINLSRSGLPQVGDPGTVLAGVNKVLDKLPADRGAAAIYGLADQYAKGGQWLLASETMALVMERYPKQRPPPMRAVGSFGIAAHPKPAGDLSLAKACPSRRRISIKRVRFRRRTNRFAPEWAFARSAIPVRLRRRPQ